MIDIDNLLGRSSSPKPKRPLQANFTTIVIEHITAHPRQGGIFTHLKEITTMKLSYKPSAAFVAVAIIVVMGGAAYAAFNWPTITSVFRDETRLPSGNRIVAIDTENCRYIGESDRSAGHKKNHYYEVKKDSKLTNQQMVDMIQGICEEDRASDVVNKAMEQFAKDGQNILSSGINHIQDVGNGKVTIVADPQYDSSMRYTRRTTYMLSKNIKAYDGTNLISLRDIKAGDSVMLVFHDKRTIGSEGNPVDSTPLDDPEFLTVLAMVRVPALSGSPDTFFKHLGSDFVRAEPCDENPSGFCRAYDFHK